jgi:hypothetical protein
MLACWSLCLCAIARPRCYTRSDLPSKMLPSLLIVHHNLSDVIVAKQSLWQPLVHDSPRPCTACLAAPQPFRVVRVFDQAIFLQPLHLVARRVGQKVLAVLVVQRKCIARDAMTQAWLFGEKAAVQDAFSTLANGAVDPALKLGEMIPD